MDYVTKTTKFHLHGTTFFQYWNYAINQYKCIIPYVLFYEDLYCHFVRNLQGKQGLIKNSAKFKSLQLSSVSMLYLVLLHRTHQDARNYINYIALFTLD